MGPQNTGDHDSGSALLSEGWDSQRGGTTERAHKHQACAQAAYLPCACSTGQEPVANPEPSSGGCSRIALAHVAPPSTLREMLTCTPLQRLMHAAIRSDGVWLGYVDTALLTQQVRG